MHLHNFVGIIFLIGLLSCDPAHNQKQLWTASERTYLTEQLNKTKEDIVRMIDSLSLDQWDYKIDSNSWSVAEVIEHLILQDRAYHREIKVVASLPEMPQFVNQVKGNDEIFMSYANDPRKSKADWDVTPTGRFCSKSAAIREFSKVRQKIIELIATSETDFRKVFTFRKTPKSVIAENPDFYKPREVRDLHQLVLNAIAHTERHQGQIDRIIATF